MSENIEAIEVLLVKGDRGRDTFVGKTLENGKMVFFKDLMIGMQPNYSEQELRNMGRSSGESDTIITVHKVVEYKGYIDAVIDVRQAASVKIKEKEAADFAADLEAIAYRETVKEQEHEEEIKNIHHDNAMMERILKRREDERLNAEIGTIKIVDIDSVNNYMHNGYWKLVTSHVVLDEVQFVIQKVIQ